MEVQLQDLLNTIKKDGVDSAQAEADAIVQKAKADADKIVADAKKQAESVVAEAERSAAQFTESAQAAVKQAGRDLLISVQKSLQDSFDAIITKTVSETFSGDALAEGIVSVVKSFQAEGGDLVVSESQLAKIESNLKGKLASELKAGLKLNPSKNVGGGFILKEDGGKAYYDFSGASIAEVIKSYLSAQIADLISVSE